jgi:3-oxoacyl-[acyl-carrier protein] reductase
MELGISGRWAIVCAASKGLGLACARALAKEGVNLVINARGDETLQAAAEELRQLAPSIEVRTVAGDISTPAVREQVLAACPQVDILINNAGGPPPGDFRDWQREDWLKALDANMLTPIELIKACVDGMAERGFGRIVNITSGAVKAPIDVLGLSNGARSGLTGFIAGLARQSRLARSRPSACTKPSVPPPKPTAPRSRASASSGASTFRPSVSASPTNSAPTARSSAAPTPVSSPGKTCCWTAAVTPVRSDLLGG